MQCVIVLQLFLRGRGGFEDRAALFWTEWARHGTVSCDVQAVAQAQETRQAEVTKQDSIALVKCLLRVVRPNFLQPAFEASNVLTSPDAGCEQEALPCTITFHLYF